jgi:Protein of unknown function (DUF2281)
MTIAEQIYTLVKALPPEQASEILTFAEFVRTKHLSSHSSTETNPASWSELVYSLAGTWAEDFPDLAEIRADSTPDILRESL